jgi:hypothetical protein
MVDVSTQVLRRSLAAVTGDTKPRQNHMYDYATTQELTNIRSDSSVSVEIESPDMNRVFESEADPWRDYRRRRNLGLFAFLGFVPFVFLLAQANVWLFGTTTCRKRVYQVQVPTLRKPVLRGVEIMGLQHDCPAVSSLQAPIECTSGGVARNTWATPLVTKTDGPSLGKRGNRPCGVRRKTCPVSRQIGTLQAKSLDVKGGPQIDIVAGMNISLRILWKTKLFPVSPDVSCNGRILVREIGKERN